MMSTPFPTARQNLSRKLRCIDPEGSTSEHSPRRSRSSSSTRDEIATTRMKRSISSFYGSVVFLIHFFVGGVAIYSLLTAHCWCKPHSSPPTQRSETTVRILSFFDHTHYMYIFDHTNYMYMRAWGGAHCALGKLKSAGHIRARTPTQSKREAHPEQNTNRYLSKQSQTPCAENKTPRSTL